MLMNIFLCMMNFIFLVYGTLMTLIFLIIANLNLKIFFT